LIADSIDTSGVYMMKSSNQRQ